jgi:hypothetical protein
VLLAWTLLRTRRNGRAGGDGETAAVVPSGDEGIG